VYTPFNVDGLEVVVFAAGAGVVFAVLLCVLAV
jgi:hypothetical protein